MVRATLCLLAIVIATPATLLAQAPPPPSAPSTKVTLTKADVDNLVSTIKALEKKLHDKLILEPKLQAELAETKKKLAQTEAKLVIRDKELAAEKKALGVATTELATAKKIAADLKAQPDLPRDFTGWVNLKKGGWTKVQKDVPFQVEGVWHCYATSDSCLYVLTSTTPPLYERK